MPLKIRASCIPDAQDCTRRMVGNQHPEILKDAGFSIDATQRTVASGIVGTGTHSASEHMLITLIKTGVLSSENSAIQAGVESYETEFKEYERVEFDSTVPNYENGIKHIERYTKIYYRDIAPFMRFPENAEPSEHLELYIERPYKFYKLSGHIDVYTGKSVIDTKTGKNLKAHHTQLGTYGLLIGEERFKKLYVNFFPRVPLDKNYPGTKIVEYNKNFAMREAINTIDNIIDILNKFQKNGNENLIPANPNSYLCTEKYCKCFNTNFCKYHGDI